MRGTHRPRHFAFFVSIVFGGAVLTLVLVRKFDVQRDASKTVVKFNSARAQRPKTVVLVYTGGWGGRVWFEDRHQCDSDHKIEKECLLDQFEHTRDRQRFTESDIVVFHGRSMPSLEHLNSLLENRSASQLWVYALWESPMYTPGRSLLNGLFNLTWTYRIDSDIWGPYGRYERLSQEDIKINKMAIFPDYTQQKSELVAWMVSNCRPQLRISFVRELRKFIKVDVFGRCSRQFEASGLKRSCPKSEAKACLKKYKFYLSFENFLCEDYITEKYWSHLGKKLFISLFYILSRFQLKVSHLP